MNIVLDKLMHCSYCNYFEPNEVEHTFKFKTPADWKPGEALSFNINLGNNYKCLKTDIKCPFIKEHTNV